jgi:dTDP-4-dehydrorhamnose reductase
VNSLRAGITVKIPDDQIGTPTYAPELAKSAVSLAMKDLKGVINIAGADCISRYEFAREAAKVFNLQSNLIIPVSTSELNQPARRPLLAGLRTEKAASLLSVSFLSSNKGLALMVE